MINLDALIKYPLKEGQFFSEKHTKNQIFIHHTSGSSNPYFVVDGWNNNIDKIGTPYVIAGKPKDQNSKYKDGDIIQCFDENYYAYHLGIPSEIFKKYNLEYKRLDKTSIGIELTSWGYVIKQKDGTFKNYVGGTIPNEDVIDLGKEVRGHRYYHAYTDSQLKSLKELLVYLCEKYNIPKTYTEGMFDINQGCLSGIGGIWSHTACRLDKTDVAPQPKLIDLLKAL